MPKALKEKNGSYCTRLNMTLPPSIHKVPKLTRSQSIDSFFEQSISSALCYANLNSRSFSVNEGSPKPTNNQQLSKIDGLFNGFSPTPAGLMLGINEIIRDRRVILPMIEDLENGEDSNSVRSYQSECLSYTDRYFRTASPSPGIKAASTPLSFTQSLQSHGLQHQMDNCPSSPDRRTRSGRRKSGPASTTNPKLPTKRRRDEDCSQDPANKRKMPGSDSLLPSLMSLKHSSATSLKRD